MVEEGGLGPGEPQGGIDRNPPQQPGPRGERRDPGRHHSGEEDRDDPGGDEAPDRLDVPEHAGEATDQGRPEAGGDHEDGGGDAGDPNRGDALVGLRAPAPAEEPVVHVQRVHRGSRVQHRVEGTHDRPRERGEQHPTERRRDKFPNQHRIRLIGMGDLVAVKLHREDAGEADQERHQDLEPGGEDDSPLALGEAPGGERALDDELVHPPVEELRDPEPADEYRGPGNLRMVGGQDRVQPVLVLRKKSRGAGQYTVVPAELREAEPEHHRPAGEDRDPLDEVGPDDRPQSAVDRVDAGQQTDTPHPQQGGRQLRGSGGKPQHLPEDLGQQEDGVQRHRPGVEHRRHRDEHGGGREEGGENGPGAPVVAPLQELRHGEHAALQVAGQQKPPDDDEGRRRRPLVAGDRKADVGGRRPGHPDEVLGRDVGRHERHPDGPTTEVPAGEEVPLRRSPSARRPQRNEDHGPEEEDEGQQIGGGERHEPGDCAARSAGLRPASRPEAAKPRTADRKEARGRLGTPTPGRHRSPQVRSCDAINRRFIVC